MKKELDLQKTVAELVAEFPELKRAMAEIGFEEIENPMVVHVMGRVMTLPKGAAVKGFDLEYVVRELKKRGFTIKEGSFKPSSCHDGALNANAGTCDIRAASIDDGAKKRAASLSGLLQRLSAGESLDAVRADFVKDFASVSAEEISAAEQQLIDGGTPIEEVQKLCDIHSALFHGHIATPSALENVPDLKDLPKGHPLLILHLENQGLAALLDRLDASLSTSATFNVKCPLSELNAIYVHYGKKESLLMTLLYRYGVTGPSGVMWGVDDEIKRELRTLAKVPSAELSAQKERVLAFFQRIRDMIYKEEQILFPLTLRFFTKEDWLLIYRDMPEFGISFIKDAPIWQAGEEYVAAAEKKERELLKAGKVRLSTGEISCKQLEAILNLLPIDITYIDKDEMLRFFSNPGRVFARPRLALDSKVYNCHPVNIVPVIEQLVADFKAKKRDHMEIYRYIKGKPVGVRYLAIYDENDEYTGTVELVEDFSKAMEKFHKRKDMAIATEKAPDINF